MKHLTIILLILYSNILMSSPRPPMEIILDRNAIHPIPVHTGVDTLLIFPDEVTLLLGHGLTKGEHPGKVHCQQAENKKLVVLRQLEKDGTVLMQVVMGGKAFVFRLEGSDKPASVIRFHLPGQGPPAAEIAANDAGKAKHRLTGERLNELIRLAGEAAFLKSRLPNEYKGFVARRVSMSSSIAEDVTANITGLARFRVEDTLVVLGEIHNTGEKDIRLASKLFLRVGDKRLYPLSTVKFSSPVIKPGEKVGFKAALVGNGRDRPLHLSLDNRFAIQSQN